MLPLLPHSLLAGCKTPRLVVRFSPQSSTRPTAAVLRMTRIEPRGPVRARHLYGLLHAYLSLEPVMIDLMDVTARGLAWFHCKCGFMAHPQNAMIFCSVMVLIVCYDDHGSTE